MIPQEQGSPEWLEWRKSRITASEIPIIMGVSKFKSPYQLWREKVGFVDQGPATQAMQRGTQLEPLVRATVNEERGGDKPWEPVVAEHAEISWAAASLDGWNGETVLEIKCPGLADHKVAEEGKIPKHYADQIQWQMFVMDAAKALYASYWEGQIAYVEVDRDDDRILKLVEAAAEFYRCVQQMEAPELHQSDYVQITDPRFQDYARQYWQAEELEQYYHDKKEYYKNKMVGFTDDHNSEGFGVRLTRVARDGNIDWRKLYDKLKEEHPEVAAAFDPEGYKREQIGYWRISRA